MQDETCRTSSTDRDDGSISVDKIERMYRALVMEQDPRSPHRYLDCTDEAKGYTWVDAGCAEGYTSLEMVEEVDHLYLFECDEAWIEALEATFALWREKVTICADG